MNYKIFFKDFFISWLEAYIGFKRAAWGPFIALLRDLFVV